MMKEISFTKILLKKINKIKANLLNTINLKFLTKKERYKFNNTINLIAIL